MFYRVLMGQAGILAKVSAVLGAGRACRGTSQAEEQGHEGESDGTHGITSKGR
jgi:hypothetical protein